MRTVFRREGRGLLRNVAPSAGPVTVVVKKRPTYNGDFLLRVTGSSGVSGGFLSVGNSLCERFRPRGTGLVGSPVGCPVRARVFSDMFARGLVRRTVGDECGVVVRKAVEGPSIPLGATGVFGSTKFEIRTCVVTTPGRFARLKLCGECRRRMLDGKRKQLTSVSSRGGTMGKLVGSTGRLCDSGTMSGVSVRACLTGREVGSFGLMGNR